MKAKLIVEGHEFDIDISDPKLQALILPIKTGYEQVKAGKNFYSVRADGTIFEPIAGGKDNSYYDVANYYSDRMVAENNARADKLMRQLRRFAVEHRNGASGWQKELSSRKWFIYYEYDSKDLSCGFDQWFRTYSSIYFDSEETARLAIETFRDELMWYFTEYKDSL